MWTSLLRLSRCCWLLKVCGAEKMNTTCQHDASRRVPWKVWFRIWIRNTWRSLCQTRTVGSLITHEWWLILCVILWSLFIRYTGQFVTILSQTSLSAFASGQHKWLTEVGIWACLLAFNVHAQTRSCCRCWGKTLPGKTKRVSVQVMFPTLLHPVKQGMFPPYWGGKCWCHTMYVQYTGLGVNCFMWKLHMCTANLYYFVLDWERVRLSPAL